ncbi:DNA polymerase alpha subunit B [Pelomyxa schiedti]|nr:DNA polymerase alpha subunit B [Pelomyxa schiedti]
MMDGSGGDGANVREKRESMRVALEGEEMQVSQPHYDYVLSKCIELSDYFELSQETLVVKLQAFRINRKMPPESPITMDEINAFSADLRAKQPQVVRRLPPRQPQLSSAAAPVSRVPSAVQIDDDLIQAIMDTAVFIDEYKNRPEKGQLVGEFNFPANTSIPLLVSAETKTRAQVAFDSTCVMKPYRYGYDLLDKKFDALFRRLKVLGRAFTKDLNMKFSVSFDEISQDESSPVAALVSYSVAESSFTPHNVVLQSHASRLPLVLGGSELSYNLFPGQVILVNGSNRGVINPTDIKIGTPAPLFPFAATLARSYSLIVAAGPFAPTPDAVSDSPISFEPLTDLLKYVDGSLPDLVILVGPFIDAQNPTLRYQTTDSETIFMNSVAKPIQKMSSKHTNTHFVIVPSLNDLAHPHCVLPQPPFPSALFGANQLLSLASNPCTMEVDTAFSIGVTSVDILSDLNTNTIIKSSTPTDRTSALVKHILLQRSFYPLFPPEEGVNMDGDCMDSLTMSKTPSVLVLPSALSPFAEMVEGSLCVNPGRITKGAYGGTFAHITVTPPHQQENTPQQPQFNTKILKI